MSTQYVERMLCFTMEVREVGADRETTDARRRRWRVSEDEKSQISDGYHIFAELCEHRNALFVALCRVHNDWGEPIGMKDTQVWRSRLHHDGSMHGGWFVMGIGKEPGEQITYHLPISLWDQTSFAPTLDRAPEWDGHTSADVVARLWALE
jgi:hypothetical protein